MWIYNSILSCYPNMAKMAPRIEIFVTAIALKC